MQFNAFCVEFDAKWIFLDPRRQINVKSCRSASNCIELISTQFSVLEMCDCVCLCVHVCVCVCVRARCVCGACVVCVCECVCVCICYFINICNKMQKNCVVCALHTHTPTITHSLTFAHTRALTCAHAHTHISHPKRVNIRRLLFYAIQRLLGELEPNSSNSTQFNLELNLLI